MNARHPSRPRRRLPAVAIVLAALLATGCQALTDRIDTDPNQTDVPYPVSLLLPETIDVHSFSGRTFAREDGARGIEGWVTPRDAFGDPTKAFGTFRFELYEHRVDRPRDRGRRVAFWNESVMDRQANRLHWDVSLAYKFMLAWEAGALPAGERFLLVVAFDSPFTPRLFDQQVITVGQ